MLGQEPVAPAQRFVGHCFGKPLLLAGRMCTGRRIKRLTLASILVGVAEGLVAGVRADPVPAAAEGDVSSANPNQAIDAALAVRGRPASKEGAGC